jgi:4,5-dihydroxyphthalate decarboxylase
MMAPFHLSIGCGDYDRTRAIIDGRVRVEGCEVTYLPLQPEDVFYRAFAHQEFDVSELSFSNYLIQRSRGICAYIAVPVFPSICFRHSAIYIRTDRGISHPTDLKGRVVGVPEYAMAAAVLVRGILEEEYGVKPADMEWRSGGLEETGRVDKLKISLPADVKLIPVAEKTLSNMLAGGEIDVLITARVPSCFKNGTSNVGRLFPKFREVEKAYFKKTGIYPIMHVLGIRERLVRKQPWTASSVYKAFRQAKAVCLAELDEIGPLKVTLPWVVQEVEETRQLMGYDFWPYGIDETRKSLETFIRYCYAQGLIDRQPTLEELFVPATLKLPKV